MMRTLVLALPLFAAASADAAPEPIGAPKRLTDASLGATAPAFSPDGRWLVFRAGPPGAGDLYRVNADGTALARLTDDPADDRDPVVARDGQSILWSSNRGKTGYDLWTMAGDGKAPTQITHLPEDAFEPAEAPIRFKLFAVIDDACGGPGGSQVSLYEKIAYTRMVGGRPEVWFTSVKGRHQGRLSPEGAACRRPGWSGDGLSLSWTCETPGGAVSHDTRAAWDRDYGQALAALGEGAQGCEDIDPKLWRTDACLEALPKRYARHAPQASPGEGISANGYSANQILTLGQGADGARQRLRAPGATWKPLALPVPGARDPVWSPRGDHLAFVAEGALYVAPTAFYLQQAHNLYDFPELWAKGPSALLAKNHFVARPGEEKEFFTLYEKVRYARRPVYVTADSALQAFHDELADLLKAAEARAMGDLEAMSAHLATHFATPADDAEARYLALYFAVPAVLLAAAPETSPAIEPWAEEEDKPKPPLEQLRLNVPKALETVPAPLRADAARIIERVLAHEGIAQWPVPWGEPLPVDFSQFTVRGHYTGSGLASYFLAINWYGLIPLPPTAAKRLLTALDLPVKEGGTAYDKWVAVDALGGAFLGRPIDGTPAHLKILRAKHPELLEPANADALAEALADLVGPIPLRGLQGTLSGGKRKATLRLFPKRFGVDASFLGALTYPTLKTPRGWPDAVEVFAALGSPRAKAIAMDAARAEKLGDDFLPEYEAALKKLMGAHGDPKDGLAQTDLYHGWLALLRTLAARHDVAPPKAMRFAQGDAWADRLLMAALGGYTQLKHDSVLYAAQEYGAECDGGAPVMAFIEQPELATPVGYVDPLPQLFDQMAALAQRVHTALNEGKEPMITHGWEEGGRPLNARRYAERLAALARKEIAGEPFDKDDVAWLELVGGLLEEMFLRREKTTDLVLGNDEGRQTRGITLVTDIYSNVTRGQALHLGLGRLMDLFVVVPDPRGERVTQGGIFSFFAFPHAMSDRLTDEAWWEMVDKGDMPKMPGWTGSFVEGE